MKFLYNIGFSLSKGLEEIDHVMKTKVGTPRYMAPVWYLKILPNDILKIYFLKFVN